MTIEATTTERKPEKQEEEKEQPVEEPKVEVESEVNPAPAATPPQASLETDHLAVVNYSREYLQAHGFVQVDDCFLGTRLDNGRTQAWRKIICGCYRPGSMHCYAFVHSILGRVTGADMKRISELMFAVTNQEIGVRCIDRFNHVMIGFYSPLRICVPTVIANNCSAKALTYAHTKKSGLPVFAKTGIRPILIDLSTRQLHTHVFTLDPVEFKKLLKHLLKFGFTLCTMDGGV